MLKTALHLLRDLALLAVVAGVMGVGIWGVTLPYRPVFAQAGAYQLQAFDTGLAFFHYGSGEQTPYYNLSSLNDFVVTLDGTRSALLSAEEMANRTYKATLTHEKPQAIIEVMEQFWGKAKPWYTVEAKGVRVEYRTEQKGDEWLITKKIFWTEPQDVSEIGMTLWFNGEDLVEDRDGMVKITNPNRPGYLTVKAGLNQRIEINQEYRLVEVKEMVNREVTVLEQTMRIQGSNSEEL
jgi:hypothetical protein